MKLQSQPFYAICAGAEPSDAGLIGEGRQDDLAGRGRPRGRAQRRPVAARRAPARRWRCERALWPGALCAHARGVRQAIWPLCRWESLSLIVIRIDGVHSKALKSGSTPGWTQSAYCRPALLQPQLHSACAIAACNSPRTLFASCSCPNGRASALKHCGCSHAPMNISWLRKLG